MRNSKPHLASHRVNIYDFSFSWGHVNPIGPRACYDEGKRVAETLTYGFQRQDGVSVRVARIFNTYGPRSEFCCYLVSSLYSTVTRIQ